MRVRRDLCDAAVRLGRAVNYDNAGTVEFLYDLRPPRMVLHRGQPAHPGRAHRHRNHHRRRPGALANPRRPGLRAARARKSTCRRQDEIPRNGCAVQCRVTTEDPENKFMPDYGRILTYRSAGGYGIRLDGGMGYAGGGHHALLRFAAGQDHRLRARLSIIALPRMDRALREFRIRGVKTNIPFLENVIAHPDIPRRPGHHHA